jgi:hypothetical protein
MPILILHLKKKEYGIFQQIYVKFNVMHYLGIILTITVISMTYKN